MALLDGERQVAPTLDAIRRDHVARYEWAAKRAHGKVLDVACGIGYGSAILADAGAEVEAIDRDPEAIAYGQKHYARERVAFRCADATAMAGGEKVDAAVCFETVEHMEDPAPLLRWLRTRTETLFASVPNEDVFPHGGLVPFHHRHYTKGQFRALLERTGWRITEWWGQAGMESEVEKDVDGRTLIAVCAHGMAVKQEPITAVVHASEGWPAPEHVAIIGLGPSLSEYLNVVKRLGGKHAYCDETWGINALGGIFQCDRVFHMDDVRIQEIRAKERPESNIARMLEWLRVHPGPVITSRPHTEYPGLVPFPLAAVLGKFGHDYFNSTAAYAVAYAMHLGVKKISLFGLDYTYANAYDAEKGRACVEFWVGMAVASGINIVVAKASSLMDACHKRAERLYGYDTVDVHVVSSAQGLEVEFTERASLPTADEIEHRYDHDRHPNSIVEAAARSEPSER